jgi:outer membrane protein OmpA-like peptidoglycan-associated protein
MCSKIVMFWLALLLPAVASASVIRQRPFAYSYEVANAATSDAFVVCGNSPDDRLSVLPSPPRLALRLSCDAAGTTAVKHVAVANDKHRKECVDCLLGSVYFSLDSATLEPGERESLDRLIQNIPNGAGVNVHGYTCDLGTASYNNILSLRRAREVASYLQGRNIAVGNVDGKGTCCTVSDDRRLNRRVEITTQKREEK